MKTIVDIPELAERLVDFISERRLFGYGDAHIVSAGLGASDVSSVVGTKHVSTSNGDNSGVVFDVESVGRPVGIGVFHVVETRFCMTNDCKGGYSVACNVDG